MGDAGLRIIRSEDEQRHLGDVLLMATGQQCRLRALRSMSSKRGYRPTAAGFPIHPTSQVASKSMCGHFRLALASGASPTPAGARRGGGRTAASFSIFIGREGDGGHDTHHERFEFDGAKPLFDARVREANGGMDYEATRDGERFLINEPVTVGISLNVIADWRTALDAAADRPR